MKTALAHKNLQLKKNGFHEHSAYDDFETENAKYQITVTPKLSTNCPTKK